MFLYFQIWNSDGRDLSKESSTNDRNQGYSTHPEECWNGSKSVPAGKNKDIHQRSSLGERCPIICYRFTFSSFFSYFCWRKPERESLMGSQDWYKKLSENISLNRSCWNRRKKLQVTSQHNWLIRKYLKLLQIFSTRRRREESTLSTETFTRIILVSITSMLMICN